jgi:hypothetical protein
MSRVWYQQGKQAVGNRGGIRYRGLRGQLGGEMSLRSFAASSRTLERWAGVKGMMFHQSTGRFANSSGSKINGIVCAFERKRALSCGRHVILRALSCDRLLTSGPGTSNCRWKIFFARSVSKAKMSYQYYLFSTFQPAKVLSKRKVTHRCSVRCKEANRSVTK